MATRILKDDLPALLKAVTDLTGHHVLVGIPGDVPPRGLDHYDPINNATLGYIHEYGVPSVNIPARPFLRPGVNLALPRVIELMRQGARRALTVPPDPDIGMKTLHSVGLVASSSVRNYITRGIPPPLSPRTIYARRHRKIAPRTGTTPLLDTGQLRNSVTYVIRRA